MTSWRGSRPRRVLVAGGGVTGLTTAYELLRRADEGLGPEVELRVVEPRTSLGGNIRTEHHEGFVIEGGPDSFVVTKPEAAALCRQLGLGSRLMPTQAPNRRVLMLHEGRLLTLPEGLMLTVPTEIRPILETPLFSWACKLRMGLDLLLPQAHLEDESLGAFVRRRLGQEALEQLAEPLLGGIYAGDVEALSLEATFPQLADYERRYGSLIRGALASRRAARAAAEARRAAEPKTTQGSSERQPPPSPFLSLRGGMSELIEAMRARVEPRASLELGTRLAGLERLADGSYRVRLEDPQGQERFEEADELVLALPSHASAGLLARTEPRLASLLRSTPYVSTGTISLGYERAQIPHALDAVGVLFPRREGRRALAATFSSSKWEGRAPEGKALVRVFVGGHRDPEALQQSDAELVELARTELEGLLGVQGAPLFSRVFRYERSNPQPTVGHLRRVAELRELAPPGLYFAGAPFDGVGIPDCVRQAQSVAARISARETAARA